MKFETNVDVGDEVWFMYYNKARHAKLLEIKLLSRVGGDEVTFSVYHDDETCLELNHKAFKTKKELIDSL